MRLPLKIYRAFPELDRFDDAECDRYMRQIQTARRYPRWIVPLAALVFMVVWIFAIVPLVGIFLSSRFNSDSLTIPYIIGVIVGLVGGTFFAGALTRDYLLRRALRDAIETARCPSCRQSLLGLPMLAPRHDGDERVRCPECGNEIHLPSMGVRYSDLIPRPA